MSRLKLILFAVPILLVSIGTFLNRAEAYYSPYFPCFSCYPFAQTRVRYIDPNESLQELLNKAAANENVGNMRGAIDYYTDAIRKDSNCIAAYMGRAQAKFSNMDFLGAINDYTRVTRIDPDNIDAKMARADTYRITRNDIAALNDYNRIINNNPKYPDAYVGRGLVNYNLHRVSYTINDLETAKSLYLEQNENGKYQTVMTLINQIKKERNLK